MADNKNQRELPKVKVQKEPTISPKKKQVLKVNNKLTN